MLVPFERGDRMRPKSAGDRLCPHSNFEQFSFENRQKWFAALPIDGQPHACFHQLKLNVTRESGKTEQMPD
jgi:hypothetical protein